MHACMYTHTGGTWTRRGRVCVRHLVTHGERSGAIDSNGAHGVIVVLGRIALAQWSVGGCEQGNAGMERGRPLLTVQRGNTMQGPRTCLIQKRIDSCVAATIIMRRRRRQAISFKIATRIEPYPCCRCDRAAARMGTSNNDCSVCVSTTAEATGVPSWERTMRRAPEYCERSWTRLSSRTEKAPRMMRSAVLPPTSAPPTAKVRCSASGIRCVWWANASSRDSLPTAREERRVPLPAAACWPRRYAVPDSVTCAHACTSAQVRANACVCTVACASGSQPSGKRKATPSAPRV